jgi:hypothetical protein
MGYALSNVWDNMALGCDMKLGAIFGVAAIALLVVSLHAQQPCQRPTEMRASVENRSFIEGAPGAAPPGWFLGPEWFQPPHTPVYEARIASGAACNGGQQCGMVQSLREDPSVPLSFLYQVIDAAPHRGQVLRFRAAVRADVAQGSMARLLVRVHRKDCSTSFRDDMGDHPITAGAWAFYEIQAPVALDAGDIEFGMQLVGQGAAWIDNISMDFAGIAR